MEQRNRQTASNRDMAFEHAWEHRRQGMSEERLLDDTMWNRLVNSAMEQPYNTVPQTAGSHRVWMWPTSIAVAASIALVVMLTLPSNTAMAENRPRAIRYNGSEVRFCCNNGCDAKSMIGSLEEYLDRQNEVCMTK